MTISTSQPNEWKKRLNVAETLFEVDSNRTETEADLNENTQERDALIEELAKIETEEKIKTLSIRKDYYDYLNQLKEKKFKKTGSYFKEDFYKNPKKFENYLFHCLKKTIKKDYQNPEKRIPLQSILKHFWLSDSLKEKPLDITSDSLINKNNKLEEAIQEIREGISYLDQKNKYLKESFTLQFKELKRIIQRLENSKITQLKTQQHRNYTNVETDQEQTLSFREHRSETNQRIEGKTFFLKTTEDKKKLTFLKSLEIEKEKELKNSTLNKKIQRFNRENPQINKIKLLKNDSSKKNLLRFEEIEKIFSEIVPPKKNGLLSCAKLLFLTCTRINEIIFLNKESFYKVDDVDKLKIKSSKDSNEKHFICTPAIKNLANKVIAYNLKRKEKYQENLRKWINTETQQMKRLLSGICKRSITSHCLRYTAAHISFVLGSKQKAQDYLGHKDSKTTDHYLQIPLNETKMKLHNFVAQNQRHVKEFFGKNGIFAEEIVYYFSN